FLVYKDRDRYVRYNAAEALNAAIAVAILSVVLWIGIAIIGVITLGIGFLLSPIAYIPAVVHCIFAIVGAVKSNQGAGCNYPVIRGLVKWGEVSADQDSPRDRGGPGGCPRPGSGHQVADHRIGQQPARAGQQRSPVGQGLGIQV